MKRYTENVLTKVYEILVSEVILGDMEDSELYFYVVLTKWEETEEGEWVKNHRKTDYIINSTKSTHLDGSLIEFFAELSPSDYTYWKLKYK